MNESPFIGDLKLTDFDARTVYLSEMTGRPDILVREKVVGENISREFLVAMAIQAKAEFAKLRDKYGVKVVNMNTVVGKNSNGEEAVFTVVDKVYGENLLEIERLPKEVKNKLENLTVALADYFYDAWKNKGIFWNDCKNEQFVYGNKFGESEKDFYVVDVDFIFEESTDATSGLG